MIVSVLMLLGGALAVAPQAQANPNLTVLVCTGTQSAQFSPALTATTQNTQVASTETYSCVGLLSVINSANKAATANTFPSSCLLTPMLLGTSSATYNYNNGDQSVVTFTVNNVVKAANGTTVVTSLGYVTSGYSTGSAVTRVTVLPDLSVNCLLGGSVSSSSGTASLNIVL